MGRSSSLPPAVRRAVPVAVKLPSRAAPTPDRSTASARWLVSEKEAGPLASHLPSVWPMRCIPGAPTTDKRIVQPGLLLQVPLPCKVSVHPGWRCPRTPLFKVVCSIYLLYSMYVLYANAIQMDAAAELVYTHITIQPLQQLTVHV